MKRFLLIRDTVPVAECVEFSEGPVAVKWLGKPAWNIVLYSSIKFIEDKIIWIDKNENQKPDY